MYSLVVFQYFIVNNKDQTAKVIDTVKLPTCTHLDQKDNVTLRGGIKAGKFTKHGVVKDMKTCIDACCQVSRGWKGFFCASFFSQSSHFKSLCYQWYLKLTSAFHTYCLEGSKCFC